MKLTVGSLFSGIGGFDLGLERAGWSVRWQVENEPFCNKVLEKHWPNVKRYGDITAVDPGQLERVNLICGGFPCQDVSVAGKREGLAGSRSSLYWEAIRIIDAVRPRWVLIENVPGLFSTQSGETFSKSSVAWMNSGTAWRGGCLTLRLSEYPSAVAVCSLSDILEAHAHPRFFLSPKAAQGILRRAAQRDRALPQDLGDALTALAGMGTTQRLPSDKTQAGQDRDGTPTMSVTPYSPKETAVTTTPLKLTSAAPSQGPRHIMETPTPSRQTTLFKTSEGSERNDKTASASRKPMSCTPSMELANTRSRHPSSPKTEDHRERAPAEDQERTLSPSGRPRELTVETQATKAGKKAPEQNHSPMNSGQRPLLVRRLTPTECERLQGFPEGWTLLTDPDTGPSATP